MSWQAPNTLSSKKVEKYCAMSWCTFEGHANLSMVALSPRLIASISMLGIARYFCILTHDISLPLPSLYLANRLATAWGKRGFPNPRASRSVGIGLEEAHVEHNKPFLCSCTYCLAIWSIYCKEQVACSCTVGIDACLAGTGGCLP